MKLLEIKNNLAKISYDEVDDLALSRFVAIVDDNRSYVGQIVNLKADAVVNYAIAKLVFTFNNEGIVENYDGTIPSIKAPLSKLSSKDILALLPIEKPVAFGELSQQGILLSLDETVFEKNLTICAEKFENVYTIIKNCVAQLERYNEKTVVVDVDHTFGDFEPIRFRRDFKLPLNARMIDYIYENDLAEVEAASKAIIQDIFYEVQEYTKTVDGNFIPFDTFLNVVSEQYKQTDIAELALLKNKLLKYKENNTFAQSKEDIESLRAAIDSNQTSYIDVADADETMQKELISHIHNILDEKNEYTYMFVKLTNKNADKKLLKKIVENEHVFTTVVCSHSYKYLAELKQRAENLIFFAPQSVQHDFASYNTFLNKLNSNEFIIYGALTQHVPFILELTEFTQDAEEETALEVLEEPILETEIIDEQPHYEPINEEMPASPFNYNAMEELEEYNSDSFNFNEQQNDDIIEQVAKDVDKVFYNNINDVIPSIEEVTAEESPTFNDNLTDDDLDFIGDVVADDEIISEEIVFNETLDDDLLEAEIIAPQELPQTIEVEETIEDEPMSVLEEVKEEPQIVPVYPVEETIALNEGADFEQGDTISHPKYGKGVIEKLIKYGNKTLCSISFENVGRRLLDPAISELEKI